MIEIFLSIRTDHVHHHVRALQHALDGVLVPDGVGHRGPLSSSYVNVFAYVNCHRMY